MKKTYSQWKLFFAPFAISFGFVLILLLIGLWPGGAPAILQGDTFVFLMILCSWVVMALASIVFPILLIINTVRLLKQGAPLFPTIVFPILNVLITLGILWILFELGAGM